MRKKSPEPHTLPACIISAEWSITGKEEEIPDQVITDWNQPRRCVWCGMLFVPKNPSSMKQRFHNRSCSAKWRMRQPEHIAKVHNPEVAAKRGRARSRWYKSGSPEAKKEIARIAALCPCSDPEVRKKLSQTLKSIGHKPKVRGGNGHGMTKPQRLMKATLGEAWIAEYAVSLGARKRGYPTCYKLDLARVETQTGIELDGHTHRSRKNQDKKKDDMLASLGWTVIRFWNWDVLEWIEQGKPKDHAVSITLRDHHILFEQTSTRSDVS